ncbi:MAG: trigger factor [Clostridiales bacterium]|nr:trigger factor [Clostridiales bacterium]
MKLVSVNTLEDKRVALEVAVGADEFQPIYDGVYRKHAAELTIPGFRKGKAPRAYVEKQYGDYFIEETVNNMYPKMYELAVLEAAIEPVDAAEVQIKEVSKEGFTFVATVTVKPEVEVKKYKGLKAAKAEAQVEEDAVENTLKELQERGARLVTIEDRAAEMGDTANIDFEGFVDGVAFEGGKGDGVDLVLGSGHFIPGFEEQVAGHKIGEEFDVNVTFPEEYHAVDLAGKAAVFKTKLNSLKKKELPEIDDDFVKDISEFDTLDELKADIQATLLKRAEAKCEEDYENELVSAVLENTVIDLPQCMIETRIDEMVQDFDYRLRSQGIDLNTYFQYTGETLEALRKTFAEQAERHVRIRLALEQIAKLENLEATHEDIDKEIARIAEMYQMDAEEVRKSMPLNALRDDIVVSKAIEIIKESAEVEDAGKPAKKSAAKKSAKKAEADESAEEAPKKRTTRKKKAEDAADAE